MAKNNPQKVNIIAFEKNYGSLEFESGWESVPGFDDDSTENKATSQFSSVYKRRQSFTYADDVAILNYIVSKNLYMHVKGNAMWHHLAKSKKLKHHTEQSMKERFRRHILVRINQYKLEKEVLSKFLAISKSSEAKSKNAVASGLKSKESVAVQAMLKEAVALKSNSKEAVAFQEKSKKANNTSEPMSNRANSTSEPRSKGAVSVTLEEASTQAIEEELFRRIFKTEIDDELNLQSSANTMGDDELNTQNNANTEGNNELNSQNNANTEGINELNSQNNANSEGNNELNSQNNANTERNNELNSQNNANTEGGNELNSQNNSNTEGDDELISQNQSDNDSCSTIPYEEFDISSSDSELQNENSEKLKIPCEEHNSLNNCESKNQNSKTGKSFNTLILKSKINLNSKNTANTQLSNNKLGNEISENSEIVNNSKSQKSVKRDDDDCSFSEALDITSNCTPPIVDDTQSQDHVYCKNYPITYVNKNKKEIRVRTVRENGENGLPENRTSTKNIDHSLYKTIQCSESTKIGIDLPIDLPDKVLSNDVNAATIDRSTIDIDVDCDSFMSSSVSSDASRKDNVDIEDNDQNEVISRFVHISQETNLQPCCSNDKNTRTNKENKLTKYVLGVRNCEDKNNASLSKDENHSDTSEKISSSTSASEFKKNPSGSKRKNNSSASTVKNNPSTIQTNIKNANTSREKNNTAVSKVHSNSSTIENKNNPISRNKSDTSDDKYKNKESSSNKKMKSYCEHEDIEILKFIIKGKFFKNVAGNEVWKEFEKVSKSGRSWHSARGRFLKVILGNLNRYNIEPKTKDKLLKACKSRRNSADNSTSASGSGTPFNRTRLPYTQKEDLKIMEYVIRNRRYKEIKGKSMYEGMSVAYEDDTDRRIFHNPPRTWESLKQRLREYIIYNPDDYPEIGNKYKRKLFSFGKKNDNHEYPEVESNKNSENREVDINKTPENRESETNKTPENRESEIKKTPENRKSKTFDNQRNKNEEQMTNSTITDRLRVYVKKISSMTSAAKGNVNPEETGSRDIVQERRDPTRSPNLFLSPVRKSPRLITAVTEGEKETRPKSVAVKNLSTAFTGRISPKRKPKDDSQSDASEYDTAPSQECISSSRNKDSTPQKKKRVFIEFNKEVENKNSGDPRRSARIDDNERRAFLRRKKLQRKNFKDTLKL